MLKQTYANDSPNHSPASKVRPESKRAVFLNHLGHFECVKALKNGGQGLYLSLMKILLLQLLRCLCD